MKITLEAYAKINLYLDIVSRRENGYHDIKGIMHKLSLSDTVTVAISEADESKITLTCSQDDIPTDSKNIAYRAAELYLTKYAQRPYNVAIHIEKRIPAAGGLAGGSTDGAAVLRAMHTLLGNAEYTQLIADSASLGADLPFCMADGAMITEGIGDVLTPCPSLPECAILICNTGEGVSTPAAYARLDGIYNDFAETCFDEVRFSLLTRGLDTGNLSLISEGMYNIFEEAVLPDCPLASNVKQIMLMHGAVGAMMSGSGSTIFGLYRNEADAQEAYTVLSSLGYVTHICKNSRDIIGTKCKVILWLKFFLQYF